MTRFSESRFSVGSNSASAAKNYAANYDRIFKKEPKPDILTSLSQEEHDKLKPPTEAELQAALDQGRQDAEGLLRGSIPGAQELDGKLKRVMRVGWTHGGD